MKKNITLKCILLPLIILFCSSKDIKAQTTTFSWNGTVVTYVGYSNYYKGTVQTWTVPACVDSITVTATGGAGGNADYTAGLKTGGLGAKVTGTIPVTPGHVLDIVVGAQGAYGSVDGGGGGGGSYVWDNTTSTLLVVAGGGGGAGINEDAPNGQTTNTSAAALETAVPDAQNTCGAGGTGGNGGSGGSNTNDGSACGGAGWLSNGGLVAAGTYFYTGYGVYPNSVTTPAYGGQAYGTNYTGAGGFGGGAGGGFNGGGGAGGYNGGGGGKGTGGVKGKAGGGGGSFFNNTIAASTSTGTALTNGSVTFTWTAATVTATINTVVDPSCVGANNGSATAAGSGGVSPYTYAWNPSANTNATATGLSAGTYTVTVTDANGCIGTASVTLTQPLTSITATTSFTAASCNLNNGTATVIPAGGTAPYTYSWSTVPPQTNATATGLSGGTYTVTVTDANNCTGTATVTITQPPAVTASITNSVNILCNGGATGSATVTPGGGTAPYTYSWTTAPVQTNITATGLSAGSYTVTVKDINGCSATASVTITQPPLLTATIGAITNALCNASNTGSATVTAGGGTPNYTYLWTPNNITTATASGLSGGSYTVTVRDNNGCTATASVTITQTPAVTVNITASTNILCNGGTTGSATAAGGGGTPPYVYSWNPGGNTNATAAGLSAGIYTVTVTDVNGCTATATVTLTQPAAALSATTSFTQATCNQNNGTATVTPAGGTPNYTYIWTPPVSTNATATALAAGSYTVVVTDANGCAVTSTITVTQPNAVNANITASTNVSCNGGTTGSATVTASSGTTPYTYSWTTVPVQTNATATGLSAGNYTVTVSDNNGCTITATVNITEPPLLTATIGTSSAVLCNGGNTGTATVTAAGGTPNYLYAWAPIGGTNATGTGLTAGTYTATVTDANGCIATAVITITEPTILTATMGIPVNVSCNGGNNGTATVTAAGGTPTYMYSWAPAGGTNATGTGLSAGSYTATVTDINGCSTSAVVTITEPTALSVITGFTQASCNLSNGSATATPSGGTGPYVYSWNPGGNSNSTATGLSANSYTVTVTDNNGCAVTGAVTLTQPSAVAATITASTNILCNGGNNGSATVTASGGTGPYVYSWAPGGQTNATATGLIAGSYTATVTDANGCIITATVTITSPTALTATMGNPTEVLCFGGNNGAATVTAGGGASNYTYSWAPAGGNNPTGTGLTAGSYTVTVTDANGCTATASIIITQPVAITVSISNIIHVKCNGQADGSAMATISGGVPPYVYVWTPSGGSNPSATGLSAGTYNVNVTDFDGCTANATVTITQPGLLTTSLTPTNVSCYGGNSGSITSATVGGTAPYAYSWSNGQVTANATNLTAGSYTLTVTDANNCTATATATLIEPAQLTITANGPSSDCSGAPVNLYSNASGGTPPYAYNWAPTGGNAPTANVSPLFSTVYSVTVTDANGCTAIATVPITVSAALSLSVSGNVSVCPGGNISLTATASGGDGNYNFVWLPGNQTTQTVSFNPLHDTTVTVELTDGCFSAMQTKIIPLAVNPVALVSISSDVMSGCTPLCIQFRDLSTIASGRITQRAWSFGNGDSMNVQNPIYCYKDSGAFSVSLTETTDSGCSTTLTISNMVKAYTPPNAGFTYSPQPINIMSPEVHFTDKSSGKYPITQWYWTFGQGDSTSNLENPEHTYRDTGTFCAHLVVVDLHGCVDSVVDCIIVNPDFAFYIPDAFTPNGDGINDVFAPKGTYVKNFEMYVYDRWGQQLFHTTDVNEGWNGNVKNGSEACQEDTYIYLINVTDSQGNNHSYTGKLNLIK